MKTAAPGRCNGIIDSPAPTEAASRLFGAGYGVRNKAVVGLGDSMMLHQIGIVSALEKANCRLLNPWALKDRSQRIEMQRQILTSDVYLVGTNAITLNGELINVDGRGNRVVALIFGPKKFLVSGAHLPLGLP